MQKKRNRWDMKKLRQHHRFIFGYTTKQLAHYYYDIAEAVDMPVFYYNIPINTFKQIQINDPETIKLFQSGAIAGSNILI